MLPAQQIQVLRAHTDIVQVVGERVALRKSGNGFVGLCPFHRERTPSFHVTPATGRAHCFGCQWDGDVFSYLQAIEKLTFLETVKRLAATAGIPLDNLPAHEADRLREQRQLEQRRAKVYCHAEHKLLLELADELAWLRKLRVKAVECICTGQREDLAWAALEFIAHQLPRTDTAYVIVAFAEAETRMKFLLRPDERGALIDEALDRGLVRGEPKHRGRAPVWEVPCQ